jgi:glutamate---cysteine ligase / carboxylate-amine ligase
MTRLRAMVERMDDVDASSEALLVGAEEEFLLVDEETGEPTPRIAAVIPEATALTGDQAQEELHQAQIEHATSAYDSLDDLRRELVDLRRKFVRAAASKRSLIVASGTYPGEMGDAGQLITAEDRYEALAEANSIVAREHLICGCHIHVSVGGPERAIAVMNRIRAWLPYLLALSANSPFWEGEDTGFDSYRSEVWARWPTSGPPGYFSSHQEYQQLLEQLVSAEVILDKKMAYWDVRPSEAFPTVEIRVNDVMARVDDVVAVAGIVRGLVASCDEAPQPVEEFRWELLRAATWRAARSGLSANLLSPIDGKARPAEEAIGEMLDWVAPALARRGELGEIRTLTGAILERGNGATLQRDAFARRHCVSDVVESVTLGADGQPNLSG